MTELSKSISLTHHSCVLTILHIPSRRGVSRLAVICPHSQTFSGSLGYLHPRCGTRTRPKQQKVAAVERLEKDVNMARRFQDMQEAPKYDEWGMPIYESDDPQNPPQVVEIEDWTF